MNRWRSAILALGALLVPSVLAAQDSNYWTLQYGPVAELLGGAVVASSRDLSATFYNPGALALAEEPSLAVSVNSFEATFIRTDSPTSSLTDYSSFTLRPAPALFALAAPRSWTGRRHTLAISALTRQDMFLRLDSWLPGGVSRPYVAASYFQQDMSENWFGLTWAFRASDTVGVGITPYVVYRGQATRVEQTGSVAFPSAAGAVVFIDDFSYSNYRLVTKAGAALDLGAWKLGLTTTLPGLRLFGSGDANYDHTAIIARPEDPSGGLVASRQEKGLRSVCQSPWSVAAGGALASGRNSYHATVEWFDSVAPFDTLDAAPFRDDLSAATLTSRLRVAAESVVNVGFGYERRFSDRFTGYGAVATDQSFVRGEPDEGTFVSNWDLYHLSAGASWKAETVRVTLGLTYSFGSAPRNVRTVDVTSGPPVPTMTPLDVSYSRLRVMLGFDLGR
jgi:hypothetical protein